MAFGHRFEQRRLRFRRRAIDLIGQHDVGENGSGFPLEDAAVLVVDREPDHIGRQQVRRKLNALKNTVEGACERVSERRFADAGNVFNQQVAAGDESNDGQPDGFGLALDNRLDGVLQPFDLVDGVGAGYLSALDGLEVSHELACILHVGGGL